MADKKISDLAAATVFALADQFERNVGGGGPSVRESRQQLLNGILGFSLRDTSAAYDVTIAAVSNTPLTSGRTLTLNVQNVAHTINLGATAGTITFPDAATMTVARSDAAQTFTGVQAMTSPAITTSITTPSTTFALLNDTATTINFGGVATTLNVGAGAAASAAFNFTTGIALNTAAITTNQTTVDLLAGATVQLNIGPSNATGVLNVPGTKSGTTPTSAAVTLNSLGVAENAVIGGTLTTPTIYGSSAANGDLTLEGTSNATKTTSYVILQPTNGNVGIRTTSPISTLDTIGTVTISSNATDTTSKNLLIQSRHYDTDEEVIAYIRAISEAAANDLYLGGVTSGANAATGIHFYTGATNTTLVGTERMRIDSSGNVGIGTTGPVSLTEFQGGLTTVGAVLTLGTKETSVVANDVLGRLNFYAPLDAAGGDANLLAASIVAVAEGTFSATSNATKMSFRLGVSEIATEKASLSSAGVFDTTTFSAGGTAGVATFGPAAVASITVKGGIITAIS